MGDNIMDQPSIHITKNGEYFLERLQNIEKVVITINDKVDCINNKKCIHSPRLMMLEKSLMNLKSKFDKLFGNFVESDGHIEKQSSVVDEELISRGSCGKDKKQVVDEVCQQNIKSSTKSPFLKDNIEDFNPRYNKKLDHSDKNGITKENKKLGIPLSLRNISFNEPTLSSGLITLRDSPIVEVECSRKKRQKTSSAATKSSIGSEDVKNHTMDKNEKDLTMTDSLSTPREKINQCNVSSSCAHPTKPLYREYLKYLSVEEGEICERLYNYDNKLQTIYSSSCTSIYWTVADVSCLYPDLSLHDLLVDLVAFDMCLRAKKIQSNKLYLPAIFQGRVLGYDAYNDEPYEFGMAPVISYLKKIIPEDTRNINQVYFPMIEKIDGPIFQSTCHWFLVVIQLEEKKCYLLDSLATTNIRKNLAFDLLAKTAKCIEFDAPLNQIFKDVTSFDMEVCDTQKQMNGHDSGMFMIKYMEADHVSLWRKIKYTTDEMRVERLKYLVKILKSEFNNKQDKSNIVQKIICDMRVSYQSNV